MGHDFAIYLASLSPFSCCLSFPRGAGSPRLGPRGKTSGTEFKFHKLVCPLHPRRNRDRLIYLSSRGPTFLRARAGERATRTVPGKRGCPLLLSISLSLRPAGRTGSRSGRPQIITRVHSRRSRREILAALFLGRTIPLVSTARTDPSWISPP